MHRTPAHRTGLALVALVLCGCASPPAPQVTPVTGDAARCREFSVTTTIGGHPERTVGTACQQADGSWRVQP